MSLLADAFDIAKKLLGLIPKPKPRPRIPARPLPPRDDTPTKPTTRGKPS